MQRTRIVISPCHPVAHLGAVARRMAGKSANRLTTPVIARRIESLSRLLKAERQSKLKMGDALLTLIERHKLRPIDIARAVNERANHLSEMYYVAKLFPVPVRQPHVPYNHYWMAMRTVRKFKLMDLDPIKTLTEISAHGFTQHRQVTAHFAAKLRRRENELALASGAIDRGSDWMNQCYQAPFQSLLRVFADQSIKILHFDPPYANYRRLLDGRYSGGSVTRTECDCASAAEAISLTVDLLRDWQRILKPGGVLLLWQASGPLRHPIMQAIAAHGWEVETVVIWDKQHLQPGNFESPYSVQTEWLWVLKRAGDKLINHDNSPRSDVIQIPPVHRSAQTADHRHAFEKPLELCRLLVGKHSYAGELVFDACACTGTMSVAAASMGRRWVYCESNPTNFKIGAARVTQATMPFNQIDKIAG